MLSRVRSLWRNLVHRRRVERELDDEIRSAFEMLVDEGLETGLDRDAARRAATVRLGQVDALKAGVRDKRAGAFWEACVLDLRHGARLLVRTPLFTLFAVASLALGIGATGAIFSLFDGIVLRKLAVPEPEQLVVASFGRAGGSYNYSMPYPHFGALRARATTLAGLFATNPFGRVTVTFQGVAEIAEGTYVSGGYYETLRLTPAAGRLIAPPDDRPGEAVAVLSHAYWRRRFGGRADVVGGSVTLNQRPFTIVGVEPAGFAGTEVGRPYDIAVPMRARDALDEGAPLWNEAFATWIYMMGRLKPGVSMSQAEQEMKAIFAQVSLDGARVPSEVTLAREHQLRLEGAAGGVASDLRRRYQRWLGLLLSMLAGVLLLASLNVATLLLSRADARQREIATRLALGAGRGRIVRQFLMESLLLAACAGACGLALASWGGRVLLRIAAPAAERPPLDLTIDLRLILFTVLAAGTTSLLFGLVPAIRATSATRAIGGRQVGGGRSRRLLDRTLVASQVALSMVLLVAAGLFVRTLGNLWAQDPGYDRNNVLMFSADARLAGMSGSAVPATYRRLLDELRTIPGAQSVTLSAVRPVSDNYYFVSSFTTVGAKSLTPEQRVRAAFNHVAPGYFATLGIPLIAGRDFDERDSIASPKVAIVGERMARRFEGNPIGRRLGEGPGAPEVVGVVRDVRYANVRDTPREVVYFPIFQAQPRSMFYSPTYEIRYAGSLADVLGAVRAATARVDPALSIFRVKTLEHQTRDSFARERLLALLSTYFGAFAILLACIGLYGLISHGVGQRTAEIGLRMALGAQPSSVRRLIVREQAWTVLIGVAAGLLAVAATVRMVQSQLFGVQPHDPAALAGATALLLVMAFAAAYLPARRASRIDPLTALRHE